MPLAAGGAATGPAAGVLGLFAFRRWRWRHLPGGLTGDVPGPPPAEPPRPGSLGVALAAAALCAGGFGAAMLGLADVTPASAGATLTPASVTTAVPAQRHDPRVRALARSAPVRIRIPAIGVSAPVMRLGKNADGTVQVPPLVDHNLAGGTPTAPRPASAAPRSSSATWTRSPGSRCSST